MQEDLAGKMAGQGVLLDRSAVSRLELRKRHVFDYEVAALGRCLKETVAWLYGEVRLRSDARESS